MIEKRILRKGRKEKKRNEQKRKKWKGKDM